MADNESPDSQGMRRRPTLHERHANDPWPEVPPPDLKILPASRELGAGFYDRMRGCVVGSAVGDALGAPFEFGPSGAFTARFPLSGEENEMVGGGPWLPGEFTDDTQMAILEALAYIEAGGDVDAAVRISFEKFQQWLASGPKDVGISTRAVLTDPRGFEGAANEYFARNPNGAAGNGSLMRASFGAAHWSNANYTGTAVAARKFSASTHGDPAAAEGRAMLHMLIYYLHLEHDPFETERFERMLDYLDAGQRDRYRSVLSNAPAMGLPNGTVWGCLRDAVVAFRRTSNFEDCLRMACDVGNDVDTVAAVAGAIAGAAYGLEAIPERWVEMVNGEVLGVKYGAADLIELQEKMLAVATSDR